MKERPIIFSAEMVRAILDGRKSQTRRVLKPPGWSDFQGAGVDYGCPYGQAGDRLWVKEAAKRGWLPNILTGEPTKNETAVYVADETPCLEEHGFDLCPWWKGKACSPIYLPRWASRITLEITDIRVEGLQEISAKDVEAEGIDVVSKLPHPLSLTSKKSRENLDGLVLTIARGLYGNLWDSLNAKRGYGWETNPWVWVILFRRIEGRKASV